jgi:hypothetical protein
MTFIHVPLKNWIKANRCEVTMFEYNSYLMQINFFNSVIPGLFTTSYEASQEFLAASKVIGEHTSKSVNLPVVLFKLKPTTVMIVRNNFMNWKISISGDEDINCDFMGLFDPNEQEKSVYCEGFHNKDVFGPYALSKKEFTLSLDSTYDFYTFLYILQNYYKQRANLKSMFV